MTVVQVSHFFVKDEQFPTKSYSSLQQYLVIDDVYSFSSTSCRIICNLFFEYTHFMHLIMKNILATTNQTLQLMLLILLGQRCSNISQVSFDFYPIIFMRRDTNSSSSKVTGDIKESILRHLHKCNVDCQFSWFSCIFGFFLIFSNIHASVYLYY